MRKKFIGVAFASLLLTAACTGNTKSDAVDSDSVNVVATTEKAGDLPYEIADDQILPNDGNPMIVDFSATWCPPCQKLKPEFHALAEELAGSVTLVTIDVDSMPELARRYEITNIPALIYLDANGKEVYRSIGYVDSNQIKSDIAKYFN